MIDKPSGIICNRGETVTAQTIQDWFAQKYQIPIINNQITTNDQILNDENYFYQRCGLVHRLDKETSGVMVLAKTVESFVAMLSQFKVHEVQKEYIGLTHGIWQARKGDITLPIGRRRDDRRKFGVREDGRESSTNYEVEVEYKNWKFPKELKVDDRGYTGLSLVRFLPKTGRTHQIRVHARQVGHPIVGDMDYGGRKRSREDRKWAGRVLLQAQRIEFNHPRNGKRIHFESSNDELEQVLQYLSPVI